MLIFLFAVAGNYDDAIIAQVDNIQKEVIIIMIMIMMMVVIVIVIVIVIAIVIVIVIQ